MFILRSIFKNFNRDSVPVVNSQKQVSYASFHNIMFSFIVDLLLLTMVFTPLENLTSKLFLNPELVSQLLKETTQGREALEFSSLFRDEIFDIIFNQGLYLQYLAIWFVNMLIFLAYFVLFYYKFQATPGQMLISYRLIDEKGQKPTLTKLVTRCFLAFFSAVILFLGFFVAVFGKKRQTMHDMITGTYIVKK